MASLSVALRPGRPFFVPVGGAGSSAPRSYRRYAGVKAYAPRSHNGSGTGHAAGSGCRDGMGKSDRWPLGRRADHPFRCERPEVPDRLRSEACRSPLWLRSQPARRSQSPAPGRSVHRLWHRCRWPGTGRRRPHRNERAGALSRRLLDRIGHWRPAGDRERIPAACRKGPEPRLAAFCPWASHQPHLGPGLDQIWADGPQSCGRDRLLDRRAFDR